MYMMEMCVYVARGIVCITFIMQPEICVPTTYGQECDSCIKVKPYTSYVQLCVVIKTAVVFI